MMRVRTLQKEDWVYVEIKIQAVKYYDITG